MKIHIVKKYETIDDIINKYMLNYNQLKLLNPDVDLMHLKVNDKIIVEDEKTLLKVEDNNLKLSSDSYQKYVCPHCKNVILIPK